MGVQPFVVDQPGGCSLHTLGPLAGQHRSNYCGMECPKYNHLSTFMGTAGRVFTGVAARTLFCLEQSAGAEIAVEHAGNLAGSGLDLDLFSHRPPTPDDDRILYSPCRINSTECGWTGEGGPAKNMAAHDGDPLSYNPDEHNYPAGCPSRHAIGGPIALYDV